MHKLLFSCSSHNRDGVLFPFPSLITFLTKTKIEDTVAGPKLSFCVLMKQHRPTVAWAKVRGQGTVSAHNFLSWNSSKTPLWLQPPPVQTFPLQAWSSLLSVLLVSGNLHPLLLLPLLVPLPREFDNSHTYSVICTWTESRNVFIVFFFLYVSLGSVSALYLDDQYLSSRRHDMSVISLKIGDRTWSGKSKKHRHDRRDRTIRSRSSKPYCTY